MRFSLRTFFCLILTCGIPLLALFGWIQRERQCGSDSLQRTLGSIGCIREYLAGDPKMATPQFKESPTFLDRLLGNTANIDDEVTFANTMISPRAARALLNSHAAQTITDVRFAGTKVDDDSAYFLKNWSSVERVSFEDVTFSPAWRRSIVNDSQHIQSMLFAGTAINLSPAEFGQLGHLKTLVLSQTGFTREEFEEIRSSLPNTRVVANGVFGYLRF